MRHLAAPRLGATVLFLLLWSAHAHGSPPEAPRWDHDERLSSAEGYVQLQWIVGDDEPDFVYQLQEGRRPVFADTDTRYEGPATASFVSGLEDGISYFRVRARPTGESETWGEWSTTLEVEVQHHDRGFALTLMGIGGFVFIATAAFLLAHRNDPTPSGGAS